LYICWKSTTNKMGANFCSRTDCENMLCDTYVMGVGHICQSCQNEFQMSVTSFSKNEFQPSEIISLLKDFIYTRKEKISDRITVEQFFKAHTIY